MEGIVFVGGIIIFITIALIVKASMATANVVVKGATKIANSEMGKRVVVASKNFVSEVSNKNTPTTTLDAPNTNDDYGVMAEERNPKSTEIVNVFDNEPHESKTKGNMMTIQDAFKKAETQALLEIFRKRSKTKITAEQFQKIYFGFSDSIGVYVGKSIAKGIGIKNTTKDQLLLGFSLVNSSIAIVCAMLANDISLDSLEQTSDDSCEIIGSTPSTVLHSAGIFDADIHFKNNATTISMSIVVHGQAITWGAVDRLLIKVKADAKEAIKMIQDNEAKDQTPSAPTQIEPKEEVKKIFFQSNHYPQKEEQQVNTRSQSVNNNLKGRI